MTVSAVPVDPIIAVDSSAVPTDGCGANVTVPGVPVDPIPAVDPSTVATDGCEANVLVLNVPVDPIITVDPSAVAVYGCGANVPLPANVTVSVGTSVATVSSVREANALVPAVFGSVPVGCVPAVNTSPVATVTSSSEVNTTVPAVPVSPFDVDPSPVPIVGSVPSVINAVIVGSSVCVPETNVRVPAGGVVPLSRVVKNMGVVFGPVVVPGFGGEIDAMLINYGIR